MGDVPPDSPDPIDATRRRRRRWRRWAIALGLLLALAGSSWHLLFFWAKSTGRIERWLGRRADRFQIEWTELRSPLPFVVEADGLTLAARSRRVRWQLTAEHARLFVDPLALLDRRLVLRDARAAGVTLHVATDEDPEPASPADVGPPTPPAGLGARSSGKHRPQIDRFGGGPAPPPLPSRKPWSWIVAELEIEDLRELWLDDLKLTGTISGQIGFELERREWAELYRTRLRLDDVQTILDGSVLTDALDGELDLQIVPWRYRGASFKELLPHLQGTVAVRGEAAFGGALHYLLGERPWLGIVADRAAVDVALSVDRGRLRTGSRVGATLAAPELAAFGFTVSGRAELAAQIGGERDAERLESRLELDGWTLSRPGETPLFVGDGLVVEASGEAPRADRLPSGGQLTIDLGRGRADDLRFVNELLPASAGIAVERGALELTGKLRFAADDRSGSGELAITGERLAFTVRGQRLAADLAVELRLAEPDFAAGSFAVGGSTLALRRVTAATSTGGSFDDWWGETELVAGRVTLRQPFSSQGEISSRVADTRPVIAFYELKRDLPGWAEKALLLDDVRMSGRYRVTAGRLQMSDVKIPFANGEALAELDLSRARRQARLLLAWRKLDLGVELDGDRRKLHLFRARQWFDESPRALP